MKKKNPPNKKLLAEQLKEVKNGPKTQKFAFDVDDDSNWYVFPAEMWEEFQILVEDYKNIKQLTKKFKKYQIQDITKLRFENPTILES